MLMSDRRNEGKFRQQHNETTGSRARRYPLNLVSCCTMLIMVLAICHVAAGTAYYVDSFSGNDEYGGTSPDAPWATLTKAGSMIYAPGDMILLRAGSEWNSEQLVPGGSGAEDLPILIDRYGEGPDPVLNGNGDVRELIWLHNQQFWEIGNLEITNWREGDAQYDNDDNLKRAIYISAKDVGEIKHIRMRNLHIHDINSTLGPNQFPSKNGGGIFCEITGDAEPAWFDDLLVEGCYIHDVDRGGVSNISTWRSRTYYDDTGWVPSLNLVVRNNVFENIGGNALIVRVSKDALVEHNTFIGNGSKISGNAMFVAFSDDAVVQYNEAYGQVYEPGETDAAGFDGDIKNKGTLFQYNYAHDNGQAGFVVMCGPNDPDYDFSWYETVRYNICSNNHRRSIYVSGFVNSARIYNNVVYVPEGGAEHLIVWQRGKSNGSPTNCEYYNNIFYILNENATYQFDGGIGNGFSHNLFYGHRPSSEPPDAYKISSDPMFVRPGSGGIGFDTVDGYKLREGSPAIDAGVVLAFDPSTDFWGNLVPFGSTTDLGVHEYHPPSPALPSGWTSEDVGETGPVGSAAYGDNVLTIHGGGLGFGESGDSFHFVHSDVAGDGEITARIRALEHTHDNASAGIMMRESTDVNSPFAFLGVTAGGKLAFQYGTASPSAVHVIFADGFQEGFEAAGWINLGAYWSEFAYEDDPRCAKMDEAEGLAVYQSTEGYNSIQVKYLRKGIDTAAGDMFLCEWFDGTAWHTIEEVEGISTEWELVEIDLPEDAAGNPDFALRFRVDATQKHFALVDVVEIRGAAPGRTIVTESFPGISPPVWLRLVRRNDSITAFYSKDGVSWTEIGSALVAMESKVRAGLAVSAYTGQTLCTAGFDSIYAGVAPFAAGDVNRDTRLDAADIQHVINAALGLDSAFDCDLDYDGAVNATDVQLVVNIVLGFYPVEMKGATI